MIPFPIVWSPFSSFCTLTPDLTPITSPFFISVFDSSHLDTVLYYVAGLDPFEETLGSLEVCRRCPHRIIYFPSYHTFTLPRVIITTWRTTSCEKADNNESNEIPWRRANELDDDQNNWNHQRKGQKDQISLHLTIKVCPIAVFPLSSLIPTHVIVFSPSFRCHYTTITVTVAIIITPSPFPPTSRSLPHSLSPVLARICLTNSRCPFSQYLNPSPQNLPTTKN